MENRLKHALKYIRKHRTGRAGFIYFIQCHDFIKIGLTDRVSIRLSALQTGCPYELKLIHSIRTANMERDERLIHARYKRYEIRGEWFQLPEGELITLMASETIAELLD